MPTVVDFYGCRSKVVAAAAGGAGFNWYTSASDVGAEQSIDATGGRGGAPAVKLQQTAARASTLGFTVAAGNRKVIMFGWVKPNQAPTGATAILMQIGGPAVLPNIQVTTGGVLRAAIGGTVDNYSRSFTNGQWYYICALIDVSTTTFSIAWWVYDETANLWTDEGSITGAGTAADIASVKWGQNAATAQLGDATHTGAWFADFGYSLTAADQPIAPVESVLILPTGVGSHSVGAGAFTKTGSVAVTGADTNSYLEVDEQPPSATDWIAQTAVDATAFLEYTRAYAVAETRSPIAVKFYVENQGAAANAYTFEVRARENGVDSADITSGGTKSGTTISRRALCLATPPSGGSWDNTKAASGTRWRFGYSSDATPDAQINGLFSEALVYKPLGSTLTNTSTATASSTATAIKRPGRLVSASAGSAITALKAPALVRALAAGSAAAAVKIPKLVRTLTGAASATALQTRIKVTEVSIAAAATTLSVLKTLARINQASATGGNTTTVTKRPGRIASSSAASSSTTLKTPARTTTATASSSATAIRKPALVRAVSAASTATAQQAKVTLLAITRTATNALATVRAVSRTTTATAGSTITILALRTRVRLISATGTGTATILKAPALIRALTAASATAITRRPGLVRSVSASSSTSATKAPGRVAVVTAAATATATRSAGRLASVAASSSTSAQRGIARLVSAAATSTSSAAKSAAISAATAASSLVDVISAAIARFGLIGRKGKSNRTQARDHQPSMINAMTANPGQGETRASSDRTGETTYSPASSDGIIEGGDG